MKSHLSIIVLKNLFRRDIFRKKFLTLLLQDNLHIFSQHLHVSYNMLISLTNFKCIFVKTHTYRSNFILLLVNNHFFPSIINFWKMLSFLSCTFFRVFLKYQMTVITCAHVLVFYFLQQIYISGFLMILSSVYFYSSLLYLEF